MENFVKNHFPLSKKLLICNRLFYPPILSGPPIRAHASAQALGNSRHLIIAGTRKTSTRKAKAKENEETKYLHQTEMVRQSSGIEYFN